jgi:aminoglycoside phosphotransferase (APT) family kinase protein
VTAQDTSELPASTLGPWLTRHGVPLAGEIICQLLTGGRSNLTYRVQDSHGHTVILRRPPLSGALPTAHDMSREVRVLSALAGTDVPVPAVLAHCSDPEVIGAPFYVMEHIEGLVIRDRAGAEEQLSIAARHTASLELPGVLARLHAIDPQATGIAQLGRGAGFIERQLSRWLRQWELGAAGQGEQEIRAIHGLLAQRIPPQRRSTLIHGDYRLDNVILDQDGHIRAVLDWELATYGDPLVDLGLTLSFWSNDAGEVGAMESTPSDGAGFLTRDQLCASYLAASGEPGGDMSYYLSFAFWRNAVILLNIGQRYASGAYGRSDPSVRSIPARAASCLRLAQAMLRTAAA